MVINVCDTHESVPNILNTERPFMTINYSLFNTNTLSNKLVFTVQPFIICDMTAEHIYLIYVKKGKRNSF
jgi:hypothetical protein